MKRAITLLPILLFTLLMLTVSSAFAVPSISFVTGTLTHGSSITISGSSLGTNAAVATDNLQWLGANIENGTDGDVFSCAGWANKVDTESSTQAVPRYSTIQAHSGSKSIRINYYKDGGSINRYKGHFYRNHGSSIEKVYITFWVYADDDWTDKGAQPQWKIWRIKNTADFTDGALDFIQNCFGPHPFYGRIATLFKGAGVKQAWYLEAEEVPGPMGVQDRWVRMEYYIDVGTRPNSDGSLFYWLHDPDNPTMPVILAVDELQYDGNYNILREGGSETWQYMLFGGAAVDGMDIRVYFDDVYTQVGTRARVEIGDNATWANCTHREIQIPTVWKDNSITITVNQGSFAPCERAYLYVVDADGDVSEPQQITFSSGEGGTPCPPPDLVRVK